MLNVTIRDAQELEELLQFMEFKKVNSLSNSLVLGEMLNEFNKYNEGVHEINEEVEMFSNIVLQQVEKDFNLSVENMQELLETNSNDMRNKLQTSFSKVVLTFSIPYVMGDTIYDNIISKLTVEDEEELTV